MNRRGFLGLFGAAVLDPERLLWVPGKKLISIPAIKPLTTLKICYDRARSLTDLQISTPRGWVTIGKITDIEFCRNEPDNFLNAVKKLDENYTLRDISIVQQATL